MTTIQKLNAYGSALEKWVAKKRRHDADEKNPKRKPLEHEPMPDNFQIGESEMDWAKKIRAKILAPKPAMPILEEPKKIKLPVRRTI